MANNPEDIDHVKSANISLDVPPTPSNRFCEFLIPEELLDKTIHRSILVEMSQIRPSYSNTWINDISQLVDQSISEGASGAQILLFNVDYNTFCIFIPWLLTRHNPYLEEYLRNPTVHTNLYQFRNIFKLWTLGQEWGFPRLQNECIHLLFGIIQDHTWYHGDDLWLLDGMSFLRSLDDGTVPGRYYNKYLTLDRFLFYTFTRSLDIESSFYERLLSEMPAWLVLELCIYLRDFQSRLVLTGESWGKPDDDEDTDRQGRRYEDMMYVAKSEFKELYKTLKKKERRILLMKLVRCDRYNIIDVGSRRRVLFEPEL